MKSSLGLNKRIQREFEKKDPTDSVDMKYDDSRSFFIDLLGLLIQDKALDSNAISTIRFYLSELEGKSTIFTSYQTINTDAIDKRIYFDAKICTVNDFSFSLLFNFDRAKDGFIMRSVISNFPGWNYATFAIAIIDGSVCLTRSDIYDIADNHIKFVFDKGYSSILSIQRVLHTLVNSSKRAKDIATAVMDTSNTCTGDFSFYDFDTEKIYKYKRRTVYLNSEGYKLDEPHEYPSDYDGHFTKVKDIEMKKLFHWRREVCMLEKVLDVEEAKMDAHK